MTVETTLGKITASKEVLNEISLAFSFAGDFQRAKNHNSLAERASDVAYEIFSALDKANFYTE